MTLHSPWLLLLLIPLVLVGLFASRRGRPAVVYSSVTLVDVLRKTLRQRLAWVPSTLLLLGAAALIVAIARPQAGQGEVRTTARGVAMVMVVDRSASMKLPLEYQGAVLERVDVLKRVTRDFLLGNNRELPGRPEDLIGLVTFARYAETVCPLTSIHDTLVKLVEGIALAEERWEGGTAIGDGLALGAARLKQAEDELRERNKGNDDPTFTIKSKAIILLTDGDENFGETPAAKAAELCAQWGIKIYAIGIGDERGGRIDTVAGPVFVPQGGGFDEGLMKRITASTGGRYWRATDGETLRRAYASIDELEKTEIESKEYTSYEEAFVPWGMAGFVMIGASVLLGSTWLRRGP